MLTGLDKFGQLYELREIGTTENEKTNRELQDINELESYAQENPSANKTQWFSASKTFNARPSIEYHL